LKAAAAVAAHDQIVRHGVEAQFGLPSVDVRSGPVTRDDVAGAIAEGE
jgi:hypothetical protein